MSFFKTRWKHILVWLLACVAITVVAFFALRYVVALQGLTMSIHGEIAMIVGVFFTTALTAGLMLLLFYSNKSGHDHQAYTLESSDTQTPDRQSKEDS